MKTRFTAPATILLLLMLLALPSLAAERTVYMLTLTAPIEPAGADYVQKGIAKAEERGAEAVIIKLDTPGGGYASTRKIVQAMLNARRPIIVYVPRGAQAASAGTFITLAANVAALAPGSNIGSAHPVFDFPIPTGDKSGKGVSDIMMNKVVNDAAAYIASIAEERGRNAKWAEEAVRKSVNVRAQEAVRLKVVDFVAESIPDLLAKSDGRTVKTAAGMVTLRTKDARVEEIPMSWATAFLQVLGNPIVAYLLMLAAVFGIIFEINNPGAIAPGVIGGIALILLFYSFSVVTPNIAGLLLVLLAIGMFILDLKFPTHGALSAGAIIAFFLGSVMLFGSGTEYGVPLATIAAGTLATALFFIFLVGWGAKALKLPVVTGPEGMIGKVVDARTDIDPTGKIFAEGTLWSASTDGPPIKKGEQVIIVGVKGLQIRVDKAEQKEEEQE